MKEEHKVSHYGPGGPRCVCCGPSPSYRKQFRRMVKRRLRQHTCKQIKETLLEVEYILTRK